MRGLRASLAGSLLLLLPGCGLGSLSGDDQDGAPDLPDCSDSDCASEVEAFGEALAGLEGVERVEGLRYRAEQITDGASVGGDLHVAAGTDCAALEDEVGRLLWTSRVSPVEAAKLLCFLPGASGSDYDLVTASFVLADPDELTERWGPRGG